MEYCWFNGAIVPKSEVRISPDDRGFLFADGIYEVVRWYGGFFLGMDAHMERLERSLRETRINWPESNNFDEICRRLVEVNDLQSGQALVYLQVTRGAAPRTHHFPGKDVKTTVYGFARAFKQDTSAMEQGVSVILKPDIRWLRCDIKSIALLPNVLNFQEAREQQMAECVFSRDGYITEASHSNIFFVKEECLYTHPENHLILPGITRKLIIRLAADNGIKVITKAIAAEECLQYDEAFLASTSAEVMPVVSINQRVLGGGVPGPAVRKLQGLFNTMLENNRK